MPFYWSAIKRQLPEILWLSGRTGKRSDSGLPRIFSVKLYLATSKPEVFAKQILGHFGLTSCFEFIGGADLEETRVRKGDVIRYVVDTCGLSGKKEQILMVGDREHDVLGAREQGIECVGVLFGYGDRTEMEECHAAYIAESVNELRKMLIS